MILALGRHSASASQRSGYGDSGRGIVLLFALESERRLRNLFLTVNLLAEGLTSKVPVWYNNRLVISKRNPLPYEETVPMRTGFYTTLTAMCGLLLISANASAAGETCPSGVPATSCYFISAAGSDTNNGTSEATSWLHAPGMPNCTGTCKAITPAAGKGFIFRGGDTWHFGNSSASPYTGGTWAWAWSGSSGNLIYIGVDQTWYNSSVCGSSWCRPLLNADNSLSTSPVASCAHQIGRNNVIFNMGGNPYVQLDNFEALGLCQDDVETTSGLFGADSYFTGGDLATQSNIWSNLYGHGWTAVAFSCSESGGEPVGHCFNMSVFNVYQGELSHNVVDGSDSNPQAAGSYYGSMWHMHHNVFTSNAQGLGGLCHSIHDNIFMNWANTGDGLAHGNVMECVNDAGQGSGPTATINVTYDNIYANNDAPSGDVKVWFCPNQTVPEYWFNNVQYASYSGGNEWDIDNTGCAGSRGVTAALYMFNNTWETGTVASIGCSAQTTVVNNHVIFDGSSPWQARPNGSTCVPVDSSNIVMSHATAYSQGYVASSKSTSTCANNTTPCAPTASGNSTVGAGHNKTSTYCATLLASSDSLIQAAGTACEKGTTGACSYNTSNHTVSCPTATAANKPSSGAWDSGAYLYGAVPNPPTNLTATPH